MSYLNAKCIIWICDNFNDEHIKAINHLNKITGNDYLFFGITINIYKFDNERFLYEFNVIAKPDYIEKTINSLLSEKSIETKNIYLEYWNKLNENLPNQLKFNPESSNGRNYSHINITNAITLTPTAFIKRQLVALRIHIYENNDIDNILT